MKGKEIDKAPIYSSPDNASINNLNKIIQLLSCLWSALGITEERKLEAIVSMNNLVTIKNAETVLQNCNLPKFQVNYKCINVYISLLSFLSLSLSCL